MKGLGWETENGDEEMFLMSNATKDKRGGDLIKPDIYSKDVNEVRPDNIALLACTKD